MLKTFQLAGALLLTGGPIFLALIWRPALAAAPDGWRTALYAALTRWVRVGAGIGCFLLAAGVLLELLLLAATLADAAVFPSATAAKLGVVLAQTDRGRLSLLRLLLAGALALAVRAIAARPYGADRRAFGALPLAAGVSAVGLFLTFSLGGHAVAVAPAKGIAVVADLVHFLTAAVWGGGIWYFALLPWRRMTGVEGQPLVREIIRRFTVLGLTSVAVLIGTGVFMSAQFIWGVPALFETRYGLNLLWKHLFLILVLVAAMDNRYNVRLRLFGRNAPGPTLADRLLDSLRRNVWVEAVAVVIIVIIAGFLTTASAEVRQPLPVTVTIEDFQYIPSTVLIPRQKPVRLTVVNEDRQTHSFTVKNFPYEGPRLHAHDPKAVNRADMVLYVPPRSTRSVVFLALEFGEYRVIDIVEDFEEREMHGTLIVK